MHFFKHTNMEQQMENFAKVLNMYPSKLSKEICKNA